MSGLPPRIEFGAGTAAFDAWREALRWLTGLRGAGGMRVRRGAAGPELSLDEDGRRFVRLSGSAPPYTAAPVYPTLGGGWADVIGAATLTPIYETNGLTGLGGKVVRVRPNKGEWRFTYRRRGGAPGAVYRVVWCYNKDARYPPNQGAVLDVWGLKDPTWIARGMTLIGPQWTGATYAGAKVEFFTNYPNAASIVATAYTDAEGFVALPALSGTNARIRVTPPPAWTPAPNPEVFTVPTAVKDPTTGKYYHLILPMNGARPDHVCWGPSCQPPTSKVLHVDATVYNSTKSNQAPYTPVMTSFSVDLPYTDFYLISNLAPVPVNLPGGTAGYVSGVFPLDWGTSTSSSQTFNYGCFLWWYDLRQGFNNPKLSLIVSTDGVEPLVQRDNLNRLKGVVGWEDGAVYPAFLKSKNQLGVQTSTTFSCDPFLYVAHITRNVTISDGTTGHTYTINETVTITESGP